jgi:hypothetical protein
MTGLFGYSKWHEILLQPKEAVQHALVGKVTQKQMIRGALSEFCRESGLAGDQCDAIKSEIAVVEGEIVDEILRQAEKQSCNLIIVGAGKGLLSGSSVGHNIKSILKNPEYRRWLFLPERNNPLRGVKKPYLAARSPDREKPSPLSKSSAVSA